MNISHSSLQIPALYKYNSLSGTAAAAQGATDRGKANAAAQRIFELVDRKSSIDPLSEGGKKLN